MIVRCIVCGTEWKVSLLTVITSDGELICPSCGNVDGNEVVSLGVAS